MQLNSTKLKETHETFWSIPMSLDVSEFPCFQWLLSQTFLPPNHAHLILLSQSRGDIDH